MNIIFPISLFKLHLNIRIFHFFFINGVKFFIHGHGKMVLPVTNHPCGRKRQSGIERIVLVNSTQSEIKTQILKTYKTQEQCTLYRADHFHLTISFNRSMALFTWIKYQKPRLLCVKFGWNRPRWYRSSLQCIFNCPLLFPIGEGRSPSLKISNPLFFKFKL